MAYSTARTAADLLTTHGFPADMTAQMAVERGLSFDQTGYDAAIKKHEEVSGQGRTAFVVSAIKGELPKTDDTPKYQHQAVEARVLGWVLDNDVVTTGTLAHGDEAAVLLDRTPFYAEQGGQVGDGGVLAVDGGAAFTVTDTKRLGEAVLHVGTVGGPLLDSPPLRVGDIVTACVSPRYDTERNHTATHLLNLALRRVLGSHVEQKGSLVDADKTRFDFSHDKPLTADELAGVEMLVNKWTTEDKPVTARVMPLADAKRIDGVRAVFGEKYPDPVRVVIVSEHPDRPAETESVEFCGGTHVARTGPIGLFKIVSQEGVAKGIRRVTAVTGRAAVEYARQAFGVLDELAGKLQCPPADLPARIAALQDELKKAQAALKKGAAADLGGAVDKLFDEAATVNGTKLVIGHLPGGSVEAVRTQIDRVRQMAKSAVVVFGWEDDGKVPLILALTSDLVAKGLKAGDLIKPLAEIVGGKGGGKPDKAEAGGKDASKLPAALAKALELGRAALGS